MLEKLGVAGAVGFLAVLVGLGLVAYVNPVVGLGLALVLLGTGLLVKGLVSTVMRQFGMA